MDNDNLYIPLTAQACFCERNILSFCRYREHDTQVCIKCVKEEISFLRHELKQMKDSIKDE